MAAPGTSTAMSIVLVHGGFVDGSGWAAVYKILKKDGYNVVVVQNPTLSLADDVAVTRRAIAAQRGPVLLVGHSYGGVVITEAGTDPKVAGLVYIAAFAPDRGESVSSLIKDPPPGAPVPPILPPQDGFLFLDETRFHFSFAADVDADTAAFMASSQVPWGVGALAGTITEPAWRTKPSWYLVSSDDSAAGPAHHVEARRLDGRRGCRQPCGLCVATEVGGYLHREGRQRTGGDVELAAPSFVKTSPRPGLTLIALAKAGLARAAINPAAIHPALVEWSAAGEPGGPVARGLRSALSSRGRP